MILLLIITILCINQKKKNCSQTSYAWIIEAYTGTFKNKGYAALKLIIHK